MGDLLVLHGQIELLQPFRDRASHARSANGPPVHAGDVCDPRECARHKHLICTVDLCEAVVQFAAGDVHGGTQLDHRGPGDALHLILGGWGPHLTLSDDEEVDAVAGGHKAVGVQHQRLIRPRLLCLDACCDAVELAVGVPARVLDVRSPSPHMHSEEAQPLSWGCSHSLLPLGQDDDEGLPQGDVGGLVGRGFQTPAHHQPNVDT
mmetsp:Transcript_18710/g.31892  ORF Transcript_18710/g.31892 Transcript_18710/m.31892 type:complete len:206 (+) Transcript_18710:755-1372(+)